MAPQRPVSLTVLAIFHFIFGGLGLLCSGFALVSKATGMDAQPRANAAQTPDQQEMQDFQKHLEDKLNQEVPLESVRKTIAPILSVFLSVLLLVGGLGLINMSRWARPVNFLYAGLSLFHSLASLIFLLAFEWRITNQALAELDPKTQAMQLVKLAMSWAMYGGLTIALLVMLYPIITLVVMFLPSTVRAFRGASGDDPYLDPRQEPADYDDRWRERHAEGGEAFSPK